MRYQIGIHCNKNKNTWLESKLSWVWNYNKYSAKLKRRLFLFRHAKWKHDMLLKCFTWQYVLNTINVLSTFIYFANFCQIEKIWRLFVCTSKKPSFLAMLRHNIYDKIATQIFCEFERCSLQLNQFPFHLIYILSMFSWYTNSTIFVVTKCVNSIFVLPIHNFSHGFTFLAL